MKYVWAFAGIIFALAATPAVADPPEQLYERGPEADSLGLEYNGQAGDGNPFARPHNLELFAGVSKRFAIGVEAEGEVEEGHFRVDEYSIGALIGLNDEEAPVAFTVLVQAGINRDGDFPQGQARLIAQHEGEGWEWNGNLIIRHEEGDETGTGLAYAGLLHRRIGERLKLGIETSGQVARLSGFDDGFDTAHYAGPSAGILIGAEDGPGFEFGFKYLRRIDNGRAYRDTFRLTFGASF